MTNAHDSFHFEVATENLPPALAKLVKLTKHRPTKVNVIATTGPAYVASSYNTKTVVSLGDALEVKDASYMGSDGEHNTVTIQYYTAPVAIVRTYGSKSRSVSVCFGNLSAETFKALEDATRPWNKLTPGVLAIALDESLGV
jgi:hypothetical protein